MNKLISTLILTFLAQNANAQRFWTQDLEGWHLYLNNGVAYVHSVSFPKECTYDRAQLNFNNSNKYYDALWAYLLAASKTGEKLKVVLDHDRSSEEDTVTCVILSAEATK